MSGIPLRKVVVSFDLYGHKLEEYMHKISDDKFAICDTNICLTYRHDLNTVVIENDTDTLLIPWHHVIIAETKFHRHKII